MLKEFKIMVNHHTIKTVHGYIYVGECIGLFRMSDGSWSVTDLKSGLRICDGKTKAEAMKNYQTEGAARLERAQSDDYYKKCVTEFEDLCFQEFKKEEAFHISRNCH